MDDDLKYIIFCLTLAVLFGLLVVLPLWIGRSYMEAQSFNRVTGKNVSTWDAMWIQLRVQEQAD